jgi:phosphate/sulfate permease
MDRGAAVAARIVVAVGVVVGGVAVVEPVGDNLIDSLALPKAG